MSERRTTPRRRILKTGTIDFVGGGIICTVKNISEAGASLQVPPTVLIPDRFSLLVHSENLRRRCQLVWRSEKHLGVVFE